MSLPHAFAGRVVGLRPIARVDHPALYSWRIDSSQSLIRSAPRHLPTFEQWEQTELKALLSDGSQFVVETPDGLVGIARLFRVNLADKWAYVDLAFVPGTSLVHQFETALLTLDYAFNAFGLRKLYWECLELNVEAVALSEKLGFSNELCISDYVRVGDALWDVSYQSITREQWVQARERVVMQLSIWTRPVGEGVTV